MEMEMGMVIWLEVGLLTETVIETEMEVGMGIWLEMGPLTESDGDGDGDMLEMGPLTETVIETEMEMGMETVMVGDGPTD